MQTMPEKDVLYKNIVSFKVGQTYSLPNYETKVKTGIEELKQILIYLGYEMTKLTKSENYKILAALVFIIFSVVFLKVLFSKEFLCHAKTN